MDRRSLGGTGLRVSTIGLGTVKLGRNRDVKYPDAFDLPDDDHVQRLLESARDLGIDYFDTAPAYGVSEARLAPFVHRHGADVVVGTKAGETYDATGSRYDFSPEALRASVARSRERLGVDRLDLVLLHSDGNDVELLRRDDTLEALADLAADGQVGAAGISAKTEAGIEAAVARSLDVVMAPLSPAQPELGPALAAAHRAGLGTIAIKCLGSGHLARDGGAEEALGFVLEQAGVDVAVVGTLSIDHLAQAVAIAERVRG